MDIHDRVGIVHEHTITDPMELLPEHEPTVGGDEETGREVGFVQVGSGLPPVGEELVEGTFFAERDRTEEGVGP